MAWIARKPFTVQRADKSTYIAKSGQIVPEAINWPRAHVWCSWVADVVEDIVELQVIVDSEVNTESEVDSMSFPDLKKLVIQYVKESGDDLHPHRMKKADMIQYIKTKRLNAAPEVSKAVQE